jgi:uncharacterized protein (DUF111 family)
VLSPACRWTLAAALAALAPLDLPIALRAEAVRCAGLAAARVHVDASEEGQPSRTWAEVRELLGRLADPLRTSVLGLRRARRAEAPVHGVLVDDALRTAGARDAWLTPVLMRKSRPAHIVSVLAEEPVLPVVRAVLLRQTTTLGVQEPTVIRHTVAGTFRDHGGGRAMSLGQAAPGRRGTRAQRDARVGGRRPRGDGAGPAREASPGTGAGSPRNGSYGRP